MPQNIDSDKPGSLALPAPLADFTQGQLLPAPRSAAPGRRETFYPVACANPDCQNVRWLTRSDATKAEAERRVCRKCQTAQAGKRGFAATRARYGLDIALHWVQQAQLARRSSCETVVEGWLAELGVAYQSQVPFRVSDTTGVVHNFVLDFVVQTETGQAAIEVNGYHHKKFKADRDAWLSQLYPGEVIFIDTDQMQGQPDAVKQRLRQLTRVNPTH